MLQRLLKEYSGAPKVERFYILLLGLFVMSLPAEGVIRAAPNIMLIPLVLTAPFVFARRRTQWTDFRLLLGWVAFLALVLLIALAGGNFTGESHFFVRHLLVTLVVLLLLPVVHWEPIKRFFVIGVALAILISAGKLIAFSFEQGSFAFSAGEAINQVLITDRLYLGLFATLALVFCLDSFGTENGSFRKLYGITGILCVLFVLVVAARLALLSMLVLGAVYLLYRRRYKRLMLFAVSSCAVILLFFVINPNLRNRFLHADKKKSFVENIQQWEPRFLIWGCSLESFSDPSFNPTLGFGSFTAVQEAQRQCYSSQIERDRKRAYYESMDFNPHNQYLEWTMVFGYFVGLAFLFYMVLLAYMGRRSFGALGWAIAFLLFAAVESFVHRQMGIYLFALLIGLVGSVSRQEESYGNSGIKDQAREA